MEKVAKTNAAPGIGIELSLGAVAGALAQIFTIPISVVTTRQQTQKKADRKGALATAREVMDGPDGVAGLWRGIRASMVLVVNPAITYGAYERLRTAIYPNKKALQPHEAFRECHSCSVPSLHENLIKLTQSSLVLGALSKMLATVITQPLIVAKVGLQSKPPPARQGKPFTSFIEVMQFIVQRDGVLGLYKGIAPQLLKGFLVQGMLMMTKERVELLFVLIFRYVRALRAAQVEKVAKIAAEAAEQAKTVVNVAAEKVSQAKAVVA
jgi:hypothetical protein